MSEGAFIGDAVIVIACISNLNSSVLLSHRTLIEFYDTNNHQYHHQCLLCKHELHNLD